MIRVRRGELGVTPVEGILRPVSSEGVAVSGASRRVEVEAGPILGTRLQELGELPLGGAVITPGGNLSAVFVIHVVVQSPSEVASGPSVHRALVNGLRRAVEWGVTSLALPPVGIGPGTMDPEEGARLLVDVLRAHLLEGSDPRELTIVVESEFEEELYLRLLAVTEGPGEDIR